MDSKYNTFSFKVPNKIQHRPNHVTFTSFGAKRQKLNVAESTQFFNRNSPSAQRQLLPIYGVRKRVIDELEKYSTVILIGETGSGKTTQIPQFMYEANIGKSGIIGVTQPRRVAAVTVSLRVADEMKCRQGDLVGYAVRFENVTSSRTKIKYMTDGMMLREALLDNLLMSYSVIILDEAHERSIDTDVLFGVVKQAQTLRLCRKITPLKIIVMSATMNVDHFSEYFNNAPVIYLTGRMFPVRVFHPKLKQDDYVYSCLVTVFQIHREAPPNHDILVFLTGQDEIELMAAHIRRIARELEGKAPPLRVYPLYAALPTSQQMEVFRPTPIGMRKVVLSTNVAETSVTISGIKYVIDSGRVKSRMYEASTGLETLTVQNVSQAQAWQRTGRAGRESSGFCYRTFTIKEFENLPKESVPPIMRMDLSVIVLQLLVLGINAVDFDFIDKPPKGSIEYAVESLKQLGAIELSYKPSLSKIGRKMAQFPLNPKYSKMILSAKQFNCVEEILTLVALLSTDQIYVDPFNKRERAREVRQKFTSALGDHITLLNVYRNYCGVSQKKLWCQDNFLNARNLQYVSEVRSQLVELCQRCMIPFSTCGQNVIQVIKCLITGLFTNIAEIQRERQYVTVGSRQVVYIHPLSVLHGTNPPYVLYNDIVKTSRSYIRMLSLIEPDWIIEAAPHMANKYRLTAHVT